MERAPSVASRWGRRRGLRLLEEQAGARLEGHVIPNPFGHDPQAASDTDQEKNVDDAPEQPREKSGDMDLTDLRDSLSASDRREHPSVSIHERLAIARSRVVLN